MPLSAAFGPWHPSWISEDAASSASATTPPPTAPSKRAQPSVAAFMVERKKELNEKKALKKLKSLRKKKAFYANKYGVYMMQHRTKPPFNSTAPESPIYIAPDTPTSTEPETPTSTSPEMQQT